MIDLCAAKQVTRRIGKGEGRDGVATGFCFADLAGDIEAQCAVACTEQEHVWPGARHGIARHEGQCRVRIGATLET